MTPEKEEIYKQNPQEVMKELKSGILKENITTFALLKEKVMKTFEYNNASDFTFESPFNENLNFSMLKLNES